MRRNQKIVKEGPVAQPRTGEAQLVRSGLIGWWNAQYKEKSPIPRAKKSFRRGRIWA